MRIGELLIACDLITPQQLSTGLDYSRAKGLPIGRVLKMLKVLNDNDLELALLAQRCVRNGIEAHVVIAAMNDALLGVMSFEDALIEHAGDSEMKVVEPPDLVAVNVPHADPTVGKTPKEILRLGDDALNADNLADAERFYKLALEQLEAAKADPLEIADTCTRLASFYLLDDRLPESEVLYKHALSMRQRKLGDDDVSIARVYGDLADLYDIWDQFEKSIEYALLACKLLHKHLPGSFDEFYAPLTKLTVFSKKFAQAPRRRMGELLTETGMLTDEQLQAALADAKKDGKPLGSVLRDDHLLADQELQSVLSAQLLMKEGVLPEEIAVESLKLGRKMNMPLRAVIEHFKLLKAATDDDGLAELVMEQDRLVAAENGLGVNHPDVAAIAHSLAEKYYQRNAVADAEVFLKRALSIDKATQAVPPEVIAPVCERLAIIYKTTGREPLAQPLLLRALELLSKSGQSESQRAMQVLLHLADVEMQQKNFAVALSFLRSVCALQDKLPGANDGRIAALEKLGNCLIETDQLSEAENTLMRLVAVAEQVFGPADAETAKYVERLGDVHMWLGASDKAQADYFRCVQVYQYALNASPEAAQAVQKKLEGLKKN